ncbi:feruloyl [Moniliophthora roreri MCA 2997]|uniref:Carboxylic ester hydrolase n=1 Tax=Moniliophthora roreri (strain MCA 2997) TaxID=1381753 RepID=V2X988_MONRO|nr:feruloyl [Moniliophthora roreri MCA 2997]
MHLPGLAIFGLLAGRQTFNFEGSRSSLASQVAALPNTTVLDTKLVLAGTTLTFPEVDPSCGANTQLVSVDICRISLNVETSMSSRIRMEAWLPRDWTGRFLSTGNGGLGGCIQYNDMAYTTSLGFATVGANNGHDGMSGTPFLNAPEVVADFAYRSIHTNVIVGKQITEFFYSSPHTKSYYLGCSTGGVQGLKSVQGFPEDFDGVVAGATAADFNALIAWSGHFYGITGPRCDALDGVQDSVIEDPKLCAYDPSELLCTGGNTSGCLTEAQVETVRKVFEPFTDSQGNLIYPRAVPGGESFGVTMYGGSPFFSVNWFRYVVYDPSFDPTTLILADFEYGIALNPSDIATFQSRNGKLLTYHGQADGFITPGISERYYEHVSSTMNLSSSSLDSFYRFFRISGMGHCAGGDGAWQIGQGAGGSLDPDANVLMAMVKWVEEGVAPDMILITKFINDTASAGVAFSRNHCRFPLRNTYDGTGDGTQPESWSCQ